MVIHHDWPVCLLLGRVGGNNRTSILVAPPGPTPIKNQGGDPVIRHFADRPLGTTAHCRLFEPGVEFVNPGKPPDFSLSRKGIRTVSKSTLRAAKRKQANRRIPILVIVGGVLLLAIAAFFALRRPPSAPFQPEVTGAPAIRVDKEKVDLGQMKLGTNAKVSFKVTNVGDVPLRFTEAPYIEVKEGC